MVLFSMRQLLPTTVMLIPGLDSMVRLLPVTCCIVVSVAIVVVSILGLILEAVHPPWFTRLYFILYIYII